MSGDRRKPGLGQLPLSQSVSLAVSGVSLRLGIGTLVVCWKLSPLSDRLRLVWHLQLAVQIVGIAAIAVMLPALFRPASDTGGPGLAGGPGAAGALAVVVMGLVAMYQFCEAMAEELEQSDPPQADRNGPAIFRPGTGQSLARGWRLLCKWIFRSLGSLAALTVVALAALAMTVRGGLAVAVLLLLGVLAAALVQVGCTVAQLVLLRKSGRFFRDLPPADPSLPPAEADGPL